MKFKHVRINKNNPHRLQPGALKLCVSLLFQYGSKCPEEEQPAKEGFKLGKARFSQQEAAACTPGLAPLQRPERPKPDPKNNGWFGLWDNITEPISLLLLKNIDRFILRVRCHHTSIHGVFCTSEWSDHYSGRSFEVRFIRRERRAHSEQQTYLFQTNPAYNLCHLKNADSMFAHFRQ